MIFVANHLPFMLSVLRIPCSNQIAGLPVGTRYVPVADPEGFSCQSSSLRWADLFAVPETLHIVLAMGQGSHSIVLLRRTRLSVDCMFCLLSDFACDDESSATANLRLSEDL
jgi:hypothetical protein